MRSERRNFYRMLHLQPDAPADVVRSNFVALMQKLRMHPDLGGDHWDAAQLSEAYAILSDSQRRSEYDSELLAEYDLATLGQGRPDARRSASTPRQGGSNRRNYYRLLQVQRDTPDAVIEASYVAMRKNARPGVIPIELLDEAFETLRDPERRRCYDESLETRGHRGKAPEPESYIPQITSYCAFCKTPCGEHGEALTCRECGSPLKAPAESLRAQARRMVARFEKKGTLHLYRFWPGEALRGELVDLSPTGLRFSSLATFEEGEVIKIDARDFRAVGEVAHQHSGFLSHATGVRFVGIEFAKFRGGFVSTKA